MLIWYIKYENTLQFTTLTNFKPISTDKKPGIKKLFQQVIFIAISPITSSMSYV